MTKLFSAILLACSSPCFGMQPSAEVDTPLMVQLESVDKQRILIDQHHIHSSLVDHCLRFCKVDAQPIIPIPNAPTKELLEHVINIRTKSIDLLPKYLVQFDWQTLISIADIYEFLFQQPHDQDHNDQNFDALINHTLNTIINTLGNQSIDEKMLNQKFFAGVAAASPALDTMYHQEAVSQSPFQKIRSISAMPGNIAVLKSNNTAIITQRSPQTLSICRLDGHPDVDIQTDLTTTFESPTREAFHERGSSRFFNVHLSPDGTKIAADTIGATGRVWSTKNGDLLYVFGEHQNETVISWSPDSSKLLTQHKDTSTHLYHVWDIENGSLACTITTHDIVPSEGNPWSPDSTKLVSLSSTNIITLWDTTNGTEICHFAPGRIRRFSWNPNSSLLATLSDEHVIQIWQVSDGELVHTIDEIPVFCFSWSPNGAMLAVASNSTMFLWDSSTQHPFYAESLDDNHSPIDNISWSCDSSKLAVKIHDKGIKVWSVKELASIATIGSPENRPRSLNWTPDNTLLITFINGPAEIWNFKQNPPTRTSTTPKFTHATSSWTSDGTSSLASHACPIFINHYAFRALPNRIIRKLFIDYIIPSQSDDFFAPILAVYLTPLQKLLLIKLARNTAHNTHLTPSECSRLREIYQTLPTSVARYVDQLEPALRLSWLNRAAYAIAQSAHFASDHFA